MKNSKMNNVLFLNSQSGNYFAVLLFVIFFRAGFFPLSSLVGLNLTCFGGSSGRTGVTVASFFGMVNLLQG
jgi:hypothetical protein